MEREEEKSQERMRQGRQRRGEERRAGRGAEKGEEGRKGGH